MMTLGVVDSLADERVLVIGSLPPGGRDLDLLVRPEQRTRLAEGLGAAGYVRRGEQFVRFDECSAESVDLVPAETWHLPPAEADALFAEARPVDGCRFVVRPAPAHSLLIVARQLVHGDGTLSEKRRARVEAALADGGSAWDEARRRAPAWGSTRALACLHEAYMQRKPVSRGARATAIAEWRAWFGGSPLRARLRAWRDVAPRRPRGAVVVLSGLDGAGKTLQAEALRDTLDRLGFDATVEWTRLEWSTLTNPALPHIAAPVKAVLALLGRREHRPAGAEPPGAVATTMRSRSPALTHAWVTIIALTHAAAQRRATRPHLRSGRVVICDRYTLDAAVDLHDRYGEERSFHAQVRLIELLSPSPARTYYVDVRPETAIGRKVEQFTAGDLARHARLFDRYVPLLGARRVDGERPREAICADLGCDAWLALA